MSTRNFFAGALLVLAIICFLLVVFGAKPPFEPTNLGLALLTGGILISKVPWV